MMGGYETEEMRKKYYDERRTGMARNNKDMLVRK